MSHRLRKRKRESAAEPNPNRDPSTSESESSDVDIREVFRKHFEATFQPLPTQKSEESEIDELGDDINEPEEEEWSGFSETEEDGVLIVDHGRAPSAHHDLEFDKHELKSFMSAKPPSSNAAPKPKQSGTESDSDEDQEAENIKNDLALQRLLSESHLLSDGMTTSVPSDLKLAGKKRHKALDLRFQALGSRSSIYAQENVPMDIRKGMARKAADREKRRRREAKESGIVLEKEKKTITTRGRARTGKGGFVGGPAVGRFKNGVLMLNSRDVREIQGPSKRDSKGRKR